MLCYHIFFFDGLTQYQESEALIQISYNLRGNYFLLFQLSFDFFNRVLTNQTI